MAAFQAADTGSNPVARINKNNNFTRDSKAGLSEGEGGYREEEVYRIQKAVSFEKERIFSVFCRDSNNSIVSNLTILEGYSKNKLNFDSLFEIKKEK